MASLQGTATRAFDACCALAHSTPLRCPCRSGCPDRFVLLLFCLSVVRCAAVSTQVALGCRGRPLRCIVSHMRAVFSSKTSSFVSNRSRMSSLRAAVAPSHRARDARAHAAHRRACTLRGACCLLYGDGVSCVAHAVASHSGTMRCIVVIQSCLHSAEGVLCNGQCCVTSVRCHSLSLRAAQLHFPTLRVASVRVHSMLHRMACLPSSRTVWRAAPHRRADLVGQLVLHDQQLLPYRHLQQHGKPGWPNPLRMRTSESR